MEWLLILVLWVEDYKKGGLDVEYMSVKTQEECKSLGSKIAGAFNSQNIYKQKYGIKQKEVTILKYNPPTYYCVKR